MKNYWVFVSLIIGVFLAVGNYYCIVPNWKLSLFIVFPLVTLITLKWNPAYVFMRFAFFVMTIVLALIKIFFLFDVQTNSHTFQLGSHATKTPINILLLLIVCLSLVLHFLKITDKLNGTFLDINKNINKNVSGSNIQISQNIDKNKLND